MTDWDVFIKNSTPGYMSVAMRKLNNIEDAEDVVQDVYTSMFKSGYDAETAERIGLRSVYLRCMNVYKFKNRRTKLKKHMPIIVFDDYDVVSKMQADNLMLLLRLILTKLEYEILEMYISGYGHHDICREFRIGIGEWSEIMHKIREKIKKNYKFNN